MGEDVDQDHFRKRDFRAFERRLEEETALLEKMVAGRAFSRSGFVAGFEIEAWLVDSKGDPCPVNERFLDAAACDRIVPELARFNFEVNSRPQPLTGHALRTLHEELLATWRRCERAAETCSAGTVLIGILPTVRPDDLVLSNMSDRTRYRALNEQIMRLRHGEPAHLDIRGRETLHLDHHDVMLEAAATSLQLHLQAPPGDAPRVYNAAVAISGAMTAVSANAPFLFGHDLWDETRIAVFEQSIGMHPARVTFGRGYVRDIADCFRENVVRYPVLLPIGLEDPPERLHHVTLHNGTIWRWNRPLIGFDPDGSPHLRIEHRVTSAGPSVVDAIANAALFFGAVTELARQDPPVEAGLPFARARANFYAAARRGLDARITDLDGRTTQSGEFVRTRLLPLAHRGLERLGIDASDRQDYLDVIAARVASGCTGTAWQRAYAAGNGADMHDLLSVYRARQRGGAPVHEWNGTC